MCDIEAEIEMVSPPKVEPEKACLSQKKPYEPPTLERWGTLKEITNAVGSQGAADNGQKSAKRTSL